MYGTSSTFGQRSKNDVVAEESALLAQINIGHSLMERFGGGHSPRMTRQQSMANTDDSSFGASERPRKSVVSENVERALRRWRRRIWRNVMGIDDLDQHTEDLDVNLNRYKPETLQQLCKSTKFTKKELQLMYRGFKEGCPSGLVTIEQFKDIYSRFFPQGDSAKYASFIFNTFDSDKNGQISFDEFVLGLSVLSRGTEDEKLRWVFNLYDIDNDGYLTRDDLETVVMSIYDMMGPNTEPPVQENTIKDHVDSIFNKMDENRDGLITLYEFLEGCKKDQDIVQSLHLFDTVFSSTPNECPPPPSSPQQQQKQEQQQQSFAQRKQS